MTRWLLNSFRHNFFQLKIDHPAECLFFIYLRRSGHVLVKCIFRDVTRMFIFLSPTFSAKNVVEKQRKICAETARKLRKYSHDIFIIAPFLPGLWL